MGRFKHDLLLAVNFINGLTMAALFGLCWFGYYAHKIFTPFYFGETGLWSLCLA